MQTFVMKTAAALWPFHWHFIRAKRSFQSLRWESELNGSADPTSLVYRHNGDVLYSQEIPEMITCSTQQEFVFDGNKTDTVAILKNARIQYHCNSAQPDTLRPDAVLVTLLVLNVALLSKNDAALGQLCFIWSKKNQSVIKMALTNGSIMESLWKTPLTLVFVFHHTYFHAIYDNRHFPVLLGAVGNISISMPGGKNFSMLLQRRKWHTEELKGSHLHLLHTALNIVRHKFSLRAVVTPQRAGAYFLLQGCKWKTSKSTWKYRSVCCIFYRWKLRITSCISSI